MRRDDFVAMLKANQTKLILTTLKIKGTLIHNDKAGEWENAAHHVAPLPNCSAVILVLEGKGSLSPAFPAEDLAVQFIQDMGLIPESGHVHGGAMIVVVN